MEDNNINFNELWAGQKTSEPNAEDLFLKINRFKKATIKKLLFTNIMLAATTAFIIFVWVHYQPEFLSTKIGIVLTILAMMLYILVYNKSYSLLKNADAAQSNSEHLKNLLSLKARQQFMQTTMLNLYFILLSAGIGLYLYEYTCRMTGFGAMLAYGITGFWILLNWFYFRPKQIKKQQAKLNEIISKLEVLNKQLE